jgi:ribosomal protein L11 methyltransferase
MPLNQLSTPLSKDDAYALVDAVMARDDLAITASAHEDAETGTWVFEATCDETPDVAAFAALAEALFGGALDFTVEPIDPSVNWVAKSLEGLKPVVAGGFYVYGSHDEATVPTVGVTPILVDAAQAFGTGHHETTAGCLEAIDRVLKKRQFRSMIDVGTGTGLLAIALAKRTRRPIIASDIDPVAVVTTDENARLNGVATFIRGIEAVGLDHPEITKAGPYDLIVANILVGPLVALAPDMRKAAAHGATIILSGILNTQVPRIVAAYHAQGIVVAEKLLKSEWATLILTRP